MKELRTKKIEREEFMNRLLDRTKRDAIRRASRNRRSSPLGDRCVHCGIPLPPGLRNESGTAYCGEHLNEKEVSA